MVNLLVFRSFLVLFEGFVPLGLIQGRKCANDGLPFDNRQPGVCQPRNAAHHERPKNHQAADEQPKGYLTAGTGIHWRRLSKNLIASFLGQNAISNAQPILTNYMRHLVTEHSSVNMRPHVADK